MIEYRYVHCLIVSIERYRRELWENERIECNNLPKAITRYHSSLAPKLASKERESYF